jgi:hypothetical protein
MTTVKRVRKGSTPAYTQEHYRILTLGREAGFPWLGNDPGTFPTIEQVERYGKLIQLGVEAHEATKTKVLSPFVSRGELIAAVERSRRKVDVCTPDYNYGSRRGDWSETTIEYVDVDYLLHALNNPEGN